MKQKVTQQALFSELASFSHRLIDHRKKNHTEYSVIDAIAIAFSNFFLHSPSLNSHYELLQSPKGKKKWGLFKIRKLPSINQLRNILDSTDPSPLFDVQDSILSLMQRCGMLSEFSTGSELGYLMPLDGTMFHNSQNVFCDGCCQVHHRSGQVDYRHHVLLAGLSHPNQDVFLPVTQEFIMRQDGVEKEGCELNAGYRFLGHFRQRHPQMKVTLLADDLYCKQPFLERVAYHQMNFIVSCKPGSHKTLYEWVDMARAGGDISGL